MSDRFLNPLSSIDGVEAAGAKPAPPMLETGPADPPQMRWMEGLFALLGGAIERLAEPLERVFVRALGPLGGGPFHHELAGLAHDLDHAGLFGGVLDPGAVVLRV